MQKEFVFVLSLEPDGWITIKLKTCMYLSRANETEYDFGVIQIKGSYIAILILKLVMHNILFNGLQSIYEFSKQFLYDGGISWSTACS